MDLAPFVKSGLISEALNLWLAVPIGFLFGFGLYHAGFTDSRKIAGAFYLKDVGVPVVMFSAIAAGTIGLWGLGLAGFLDLSKVYFLPTYLAPMAVGGLIFGVGMAVGGFCPGTAVASIATGRVDAMVFLVGFLGGSLVFGDFFPVWGDFYRSDFREAARLDQVFGNSLGLDVLLIVLAAIGGSLLMRAGQRYFWRTPADQMLSRAQVMKYEAPVVALAVAVAAIGAFVPTTSFVPSRPEPYYIIERQAGPPIAASPVVRPATPDVPAQPAAPAKRREGC
ncbi:MAG: YeeE/YedE family protein [Proteobacteria bacterium]|nr:YeeE/YedE family protein [Pseudomonadota bacterium]